MVLGRRVGCLLALSAVILLTGSAMSSVVLAPWETEGVGYPHTYLGPGSVYSNSVTGGTVPPGMSVDIFGFLGGTPTTPGTYEFTITWVHGITGDTVVTTYEITIYAHVGIEGDWLEGGHIPDPIPLPDATVGEPYTASVTITGGLAPFSVPFPPTLPAGLSLSVSGSFILFTGTPTQPVVEGFYDVGVVDSLVGPGSGFVAIRAVSLLVQDKPAAECKVVNLIRTLPARAEGTTFDLTKLKEGTFRDFVWTSDTEGKDKTFIVKMSTKPIGEEGAEEPFKSFKVKNESGTTKDGLDAGVEIAITKDKETLEITITSVFGQGAAQREYILRVSCKDKPKEQFKEDRFFLVGAICKLDLDGKRAMCEEEKSADFTAKANVQGGKIKSGRITWTLDQAAAKVRRKGDPPDKGAQTFLDTEPMLDGSVARSEATIDRDAESVVGLTVVADGILASGARFRCARSMPAFIVSIALSYVKARRALCLGKDEPGGDFTVLVRAGAGSIAGTVHWTVKRKIRIVSGVKEVEELDVALPADGKVTVKIKAAAEVEDEERGEQNKVAVKFEGHVVIEGKEFKAACSLAECPVRLLKRRTVNVALHVGQVGGVNRTDHAGAIRAADFPAKLTNEPELGLKDTWDQGCITFKVSYGGDSAFAAGSFTGAGNFDAATAGTTRDPNVDKSIDVHFVGGTQIDNTGLTPTPSAYTSATATGNDWNAQVYLSDTTFKAGTFVGWSLLSHELGHALGLSGDHTDVVHKDCFGAIENEVNGFPTDRDKQIGMGWAAIEKMINLIDQKTFK